MRAWQGSLIVKAPDVPNKPGELLTTGRIIGRRPFHEFGQPLGPEARGLRTGDERKNRASEGSCADMSTDFGPERRDEFLPSS